MFSLALAAPVQKARATATALRPTSRIIVQFSSPFAADLVAQRLRLAVQSSLPGHPEWVILQADSIEGAQRAEVSLRSDPAVVCVQNDSYVHMVKHAFVPNDPYYSYNNPTGSTGQWHLASNTTGYVNVGATAAWNKDITGLGVVIGIVDDSLETTHPDLSANYVSSLSWDFGQNDAVPNPVTSDDIHGTSVAGVAAARGGNGIGVTGAAPYAGLAGLRCDFDNGTISQFVNATLYKSSGAPADRGIGIKNHSYSYGYAYEDASAEKAALTTSVLAGTIHVMSAGNDRGGSVEDTNRLMVQGNHNSITVAALGHNGVYSYYSDFGASVFCTAPTSDDVAGIVTTDRTGSFGYNGFASDLNYTPSFGGTSSSSPLTAGVLALAKQVAPAMDTRLAKHILARTCKVVDPWDATIESDGGWKTNSAGFRFNQNYGFGNLSVGDLVAEAAKDYTSTPQVTRTIGPVTVNTALPDGDPVGVTRTFTVSAFPNLEDVVVRLNVTAGYRGDISAWLTSPSGMTQRLVRESSNAGGSDIVNWDFCANGFWGENTGGTWKLTVADALAGDSSTWNNFIVTFYHGERVTKLGSNVLFADASGNMQMSSIVLYNNAPFPLVSQTLPSCSTGYSPVAVGDIDNDGRNDIVTVNSAGQIEAILMYRYDAKSRQSVGTLPANTKIYAVADIDGDKRPDLCWYNTSTLQTGYYRLTGSGVLGTSVVVGTLASGLRPVGAADATGDGQPDIICDKSTGTAAVWIWQLSPGGTPFGYIYGGFQAGGFTLLGIGDYNNDNQPDYLAKRNTTGVPVGYRMNVLTVTNVETLVPSPPSGYSAVTLAAL